MKKLISVLLAAALILAAGFLGVTAWIGAPLDKNDDSVRIVSVSEGSGTYDIAVVLEENGIIDNTSFFRILSKLKRYDGRYIAGAYELSPSMSMTEIMKKTASGDTATESFTVIEGQTVEKIAHNLDAAGIVDYDEFRNEEQHGVFDYDFLEGCENSMYRLEGFLYPDTYHFDMGTDAHDVIDIMLKRFDEVIYSQYKDVSCKYSFRETVIIASIIQREAGRKEDMADVSSVIYNRLDIGMALQMDSVVSYILQEDKVDLTYSDINVDSDYNPYKNTGLPPGPISSPGLDAVKAAFNPNDTDYLYFVLSDKLDGSTNFSSDYSQFEKDKKAYYDAKDK